MRSYTRHQLKQDRFATAVGEQVDWAVEHRDKLIWGGGILAAVLAIVIGGWFYLDARNTAASVAMGNAVDIYQAQIRPADQPAYPGILSYTSAAERAKNAKAAFEKVANGYPFTRTARLARYFIGLTDIDLGNNADAERQLKEVADAGPADLTALARMALANLYRNTNRDQQAIDLYKQLADHPTNTVSKTAAQLQLADLYTEKQPSEAKRIYEQIRIEDPKGAAAEVAATKLQAMK